MGDAVMKTKDRDLIYGDRPAHKHTFNDETWLCNSPYCEILSGLPHPHDGGPNPILPGREPWRGRM